MIIDVALALIWRGDRWFVQRRDPSNPTLPGLWEFPGGKVEAGETPEAALRRELWEEVRIVPGTIRPGPILQGVVRLNTFLVETDDDPRTALAWGWFTVEELLRLPIPPMNARLIRSCLSAANGRLPF